MAPADGVTLAAASRVWFRLGLVSFGGPAGQIALLHREVVEDQRWLSERRFLHALNYCMVLPGPEATQLVTYLGFLMHGVMGGLVAGGLFLLPALGLLIGLATVYALWGTLPLLASVFWALKPAVLAIVLQAAWRLGRRTLHHPFLALLALGSFLGLTVVGMAYPLVVVLAALAGWLAGRWRPRWVVLPDPPAPGLAEAPISPVEAAPALHDDATATPPHARASGASLAAVMLLWGLAFGVPLAGLSLIGGWNGLLAVMARFFTQVALVCFGGAYAVLPYVAQAAVEQFGWLSAAQMVDGLALGETTPGPLIMVVAFVGFMGGWSSGLFAPASPWLGAVAATLVVVWFTFLPSFGFILAGAPLVEASRGDLRLDAPLTAITAAVVGVIASLAVLFAGPVLWPEGTLQPAGLGLALAALALLLRGGWGVTGLIALAAVLGMARALVRGG
ncbi:MULTISPECIES: chromate efflux transporter [Aphanothece]|uniref:chromate efflux transporter n=1 Tax=Aphanothece TaxID=1121 RepID=UPI003984EBCE